MCSEVAAAHAAGDSQEKNSECEMIMIAIERMG